MNPLTSGGATVPASVEVLDSLNVDLMKEHGAIVQYLLHATQVRDTALRYSVTEAAREEMWHMEWLIEAIRERGGSATLERQEGIFMSMGLVESLQADVSAEVDAIDHYGHTLRLIGDSDEELTRLIERIVDDERYHRGSFQRMADRVNTEGEPAYAARPEATPTDGVRVAPMFDLEYEGLLQYLWNKYGVGEDAGDEAETYFELAINEMRHLNWLASCFGGMGVPNAPDVPLGEVVEPSSVEGARRRAAEYERKAEETIARARDGVEGEPLSTEMRRIDYQHGYHRYQLEHLEESAQSGGGG